MEFLELEDFTEETINKIIESGLEESINIEFKSALALSKESSIKKEISKDISAFANSDGGLLFYGINEDNHIATSCSFIDGNTYTKEWLENVIISNIQPRIEGLKIYPIRFDQDFNKTIYAVKIPNSNIAPHINGDKKYYRRFNFQSVPMEEYEIRNLYLRQRENKIYVDRLVIKPIDINQQNDYEYLFYIEVQIVSEGLYVADKYKLACILNGTEDFVLNYDRTKYNITNKLTEGVKISSNEMIPLFPNEILNALCFTIKIPKDKFEDVIKSLKFTVLTFNVTDFEENEMNLSELLLKAKEKYYQ